MSNVSDIIYFIEREYILKETANRFDFMFLRDEAQN